MSTTNIEVGQQWIAVPYTAEDVDHPSYVVESVEGGMVTLRRDDGKLTKLEGKMVPIYMPLVADV